MRSRSRFWALSPGMAAVARMKAGRIAAVVSVVALNLLALIALSREVADYYSQEMTEPSSSRAMESLRLDRLAACEDRP